MKLAEYERAFLRSVRFRDTPPELQVAVQGAGTLGSCAAIDVYRRMYWYRLVDAHFALFPRTAKAMGRKRFTESVCACLAVQPSRVPVLEKLAMPFAHWFESIADFPPAEAALVRLEAMGIESLLAADPPGAIFDVTMTQAKAFATTVLYAVPSLRTCRSFRAAVDAYERIEPDENVTDEGEPHAGMLPQLACDVLVVRREFSVRHLVLETGEAELLERAKGGLVAGELLANLAGPSLEAERAFQRFATFIDHQCFFVRN